MKIVWSQFLTAVVLLVMCGPAVAADQGISVHTLIQDPARYDGKVVTVVGTITAYRERVSNAGNPYTTFRLSDGDEFVAVFSWNKQGFSNGQRVRVTGTFSKIREAGTSPVGNEIQAYRIEALP
ncbi:MAG TPA: hypothetical protein VFP86_16390 [bacterium]|nr:hypothetical protein [bacterium]